MFAMAFLACAVLGRRNGDINEVIREGYGYVAQINKILESQEVMKRLAGLRD